jgi:hypothetical protein
MNKFKIILKKILEYTIVIPIVGLTMSIIEILILWSIFAIIIQGFKTLNF